LVYDWNFPDAERELRRAISLNPNYDEAYHGYGLYLSVVDRLDKAVAAFQRARQLDPFTIPLRQNAAWIYAHAHRYDLAIPELQGLLQVDPDNSGAHHMLGWIYVSQGNAFCC